MRIGSFIVSASVGLVALGTISSPRADWVEFVDQTSTRLLSEPGLGVDDPREKVYAWGDVDRDGDTDLVVGRKEPFFESGNEPNVLFLNENGVLVDRTAEFASQSSVPGDQGFLTPTSDRGLTLVDVDLDGWLDIVTAPAFNNNEPQHIGHPRVYRNLGCTGSCDGTQDWAGFRYEEQRIPALLTDDGISGKNPCFFDVVAGDIGSPDGDEGDGYPDLWFSDHDASNSEACGFYDFNSKLLLNLGQSNPGYFVDVTESSFTEPFQIAEGTTVNMADLNGDGVNDLVRQNVSEVRAAYNWPFEQGTFFIFNDPYGPGAYATNTGDLNNDGKIDMIVTEDGDDRYLLNQTSNSSGPATFIQHVFSYAHQGSGAPAGDEGLAARNKIADLNMDGWPEVLITDARAENTGCSRRLHVYRNLGGSPGDEVVLEEQTTGSGCAPFLGNPETCLVMGLPASDLEGSWDTAVFDVNGDGWNDLVLGRCNGTRVYINVPPSAPAGDIDATGNPGAQLMLNKTGQGAPILSWGASCVSGDTDYAIYSGSLDEVGNHSPSTCSTGGATAHTLFAGQPNSYYLVVPHNQVLEGSYGKTGSGQPRPVGSPSCRAQYVTECAEP